MEHRAFDDRNSIEIVLADPELPNSRLPEAFGFHLRTPDTLQVIDDQGTSFCVLTYQDKEVAERRNGIVRLSCDFPDIIKFMSTKSTFGAPRSSAISCPACF
jgi:hypothetical protein